MLYDQQVITKLKLKVKLCLKIKGRKRAAANLDNTIHLTNEAEKVFKECKCDDEKSTMFFFGTEQDNFKTPLAIFSLIIEILLCTHEVCLGVELLLADDNY